MTRIINLAKKIIPEKTDREIKTCMWSFTEEQEREVAKLTGMDYEEYVFHKEKDLEEHRKRGIKYYEIDYEFFERWIKFLKYLSKRRELSHYEIDDRMPKPLKGVITKIGRKKSHSIGYSIYRPLFLRYEEYLKEVQKPKEENGNK